MTGQPAAIVEMIHSEEIVLAFDLAEQTASVLALLKKYADLDMDLADACIVRMTEHGAPPPCAASPRLADSLGSASRRRDMWGSRERNRHRRGDL